LNEIFPGKLEEKMNFLEKCVGNKEVEITKIVELYLINLSRMRREILIMVLETLTLIIVMEVS